MNYPDERNKILRSRSTEWRFRYMLRDLDNLDVRQALSTLEHLTKLMQTKREWLANRKR